MDKIVVLEKVDKDQKYIYILLSIKEIKQNCHILP